MSNTSEIVQRYDRMPSSIQIIWDYFAFSDTSSVSSPRNCAAGVFSSSSSEESEKYNPSSVSFDSFAIKS